jgi:hypothetical protein
MTNMNALRDDERGHLLAASLGGTNEEFNIVPQTSLINRNVGSQGYTFWYPLEQQIREFLDRNPGAYVLWDTLVFYGDLTVNRRPIAFAQQVALYNDANLTTDSGTIFYYNNPEGDCP